MTTQKKTFRRKIAYLCAIAVLLVPLSYISAPARTANSGGGVLTELRRKERLSQAQLGKIDPASASMSLATLGMRGVAANQLWGLATHYKKTENWDAFKATLNQISKLQPNFVSVWQFQAWNISYNVSVEFDDFRHRYHWVKKGVDYLIEGNEYNRDEPLLLWDTGWFFGHKMGRADEYAQFRRLFRNDEDFHASLPIDFENPNNQGPDGKPDNWKVAHNYFTQAQRAVERGARLKSLSMGYWAGNRRIIDKKETAIKGKNPLVFHSDSPKALINYADAIEEDGYLDEIGQLAWRDAGRAWSEYGDRPIISSFGVKIRLNDRERNEREFSEAIEKLGQYNAGIKERLVAERRAALPEDQRAVLEIPEEERDNEQQRLAYQAQQAMNVTLIDVANEVPEPNREDARIAARRAMDSAEQVEIIDRYREIVNFVYWKKRCEAEQLDMTIEARKLVLDADRAFAEGELLPAKENYEKAWDLWADIFEEFDVLIDDVEGEILYEAIERYQRLLGQLEESFPPEDFPLMRLVEQYAETNYAAMQAEAAAAAEAEAEPDADATEESAPATEESAPAGSSATELSSENQRFW